MHMEAQRFPNSRKLFDKLNTYYMFTCHIIAYAAARGRVCDSTVDATGDFPTDGRNLRMGLGQPMTSCRTTKLRRLFLGRSLLISLGKYCRIYFRRYARQSDAVAVCPQDTSRSDKSFLAVGFNPRSR